MRSLAVVVAVAAALGCATARPTARPATQAAAVQPGPAWGFHPLAMRGVPARFGGPGEWQLTERGWVFVAAGESLDSPPRGKHVAR